MITPMYTPDKSTFGTPCRWRNFHLLIKGKVVRFDIEGVLAVLALAGLGIHTIYSIFIVPFCKTTKKYVYCKAWKLAQ